MFLKFKGKPAPLRLRLRVDESSVPIHEFADIRMINYKNIVVFLDELQYCQPHNNFQFFVLF